MMFHGNRVYLSLVANFDYVEDSEQFYILSRGRELKNNYLVGALPCEISFKVIHL